MRTAGAVRCAGVGLCGRGARTRGRTPGATRPGRVSRMCGSHCGKFRKGSCLALGQRHTHKTPDAAIFAPRGNGKTRPEPGNTAKTTAEIPWAPLSADRGQHGRGDGRRILLTVGGEPRQSCRAADAESSQRVLRQSRASNRGMLIRGTSSEHAGTRTPCLRLC